MPIFRIIISSILVTRREVHLWVCFIEPAIQLFIAHPKGDPLSTERAVHVSSHDWQWRNGRTSEPCW
jgi:hypothetical protein